ncbi:hypothetical protein ACFL35_21010, partial [Candidatus Riflebacteria bacterium]
MAELYPWTESRIKELENCIAELEKDTTVEFVVVFNKFSGMYNDAKHIAGLILSFLFLFFILFSPFDFEPKYIPAFLIVSYIIGYALAHYFPRLSRIFLSVERLQQNVTRMAQATFFKQN